MLCYAYIYIYVYRKLNFSITLFKEVLFISFFFSFPFSFNFRMHCFASVGPNSEAKCKTGFPQIEQLHFKWLGCVSLLRIFRPYNAGEVEILKQGLFS